MAVPEGLLADFEQEALYRPEAWFIHEVLEVEPDQQRLVARMDTERLGFLVHAQREVAGHLKHLPAAVVIQATGTLGQLYAVYALGLRSTQGWAGYGTHITKARFGKMGEIGPPVTATVQCVRQRRIRQTWFCDFDFLFEQEGESVYSSRQTAAWRQLT